MGDPDKWAGHTETLAGKWRVDDRWTGAWKKVECDEKVHELLAY